MELFESYDRRIDKILGVLKEYGIGSVEECRDICAAAGLDPYKIVKDVQPIAFENAGWAYTVGAAIAIKTNARTAVEAAKAIGIGLQSFCIPGSVAEDRKVGLGHGNLGAMLLRDETKCFAFLAGHERHAHAWFIRLANQGCLLGSRPAPPALVSGDDLNRFCIPSHTHSPMPISKISDGPCPEIQGAISPPTGIKRPVVVSVSVFT